VGTNDEELKAEGLNRSLNLSRNLGIGLGVKATERTRKITIKRTIGAGRMTNDDRRKRKSENPDASGEKRERGDDLALDCWGRSISGSNLRDTEEMETEYYAPFVSFARHLPGSGPPIRGHHDVGLAKMAKQTHKIHEREPVSA
jgi:hypothetical protein